MTLAQLYGSFLLLFMGGFAACAQDSLVYVHECRGWTEQYTLYTANQTFQYEYKGGRYIWQGWGKYRERGGIYSFLFEDRKYPYANEPTIVVERDTTPCDSLTLDFEVEPGRTEQLDARIGGRAQVLETNRVYRLAHKDVDYVWLHPRYGYAFPRDSTVRRITLNLHNYYPYITGLKHTKRRLKITRRGLRSYDYQYCGRKRYVYLTKRR